MAAQDPVEEYRFGPFRFDCPTGRVYRGETEVSLPPRASVLLEHLLENAGEVCTKQELLDLVWADVHVGEESLTQAISLIRQALEDDARRPTYVETIQGRGYRFIAEVERQVAEPSTAPADRPFGSYEIVERIGVGGMGRVYRARDMRLGRDVAIKVLPKELVDDRDALLRFEREAKLLAALNHPNIATLYALEESRGRQLLVMELVEGRTLAECLASGPLPIADVLQVGRQVAAALEAAHARGIVHRDLKPANVMITPDDTVKILDFGVAKALDLMGMDTSGSSQPTQLTRAGMAVGTPPYMSPEQVEDRALDERADLWGFGCLLFEALVGRRAFDGDTAASTAAAILADEPDWQALPETTPLRVRLLLERCLQKDPRRRLHHAADARIEIEEALSQPPELLAAGTVTSQPPRRQATAGGIPWKMAIPAAATLVGVAVLGTWFASRPAPPAPEPVGRFAIDLPQHVYFTGAGNNVIAASRDGTRIAFAGNNQLWIHSIKDGHAASLDGTKGATSPFFSPNGQQVGFFSIPDGQLKRIAVTSGASVPLIAARNLFGASWAEYGMIYYGQGPTGIWRVSQDGGEPENVVDMGPGERAHGPQLLPGGDWLLFTVTRTETRGAWNEGSIVAASLATDERVPLITGGTEARYVPTGHIVYVRDATLFAVAFDLDAMEVRSDPVSLVEGIRMTEIGPTGAANYALTSAGGLVYVPGTSITDERTLVWVNRQGDPVPASSTLASYDTPAVSPDGRRVAVEIEEEDTARIWILDLANDASTPLTVDADSGDPVWSPDGVWVAFASNPEGNWNLYRRRADFSGPAELLLSGAETIIPRAWTESGLLMYTTGGWDIGYISIDGDRSATEFIASPASEINARVSPNGRWIAYDSDESGAYQIYVQPFPDGGRRYTISNQGGTEPVWSADGTELYFRDDPGYAGIMVVDVNTEGDFTHGPPRQLFSGSYFNVGGPNYDVARDGRFLMISAAGLQGEGAQDGAQINIILNWFEELKERVPTGR